MKNKTHKQHIGNWMSCKKWINNIYSQLFIRVVCTAAVESGKNCETVLCICITSLWNSLLQEVNMESSKIIKKIHWRNVNVLSTVLWLQPQDYWTELPLGIGKSQDHHHHVPKLGEKYSLLPILLIIYLKQQKEAESLYPGLVWWFFHKGQTVGEFF